MSKKNKMFRSWQHNYPDGDAHSAFDFAWNHRKDQIASLQADLIELLGTHDRLDKAEARISSHNTRCDEACNATGTDYLGCDSAPEFMCVACPRRYRIEE